MKLRSVLMIVALMAGSGFAGAASATTKIVDVNGLNPIAVPPLESFTPGVSFTTVGSDTALYEFDLTSPLTVTDASFTNSPAGGQGAFKFTSIKLYEGYGTTTLDPSGVATLSNDYVPHVGGSNSGVLDEITLAAGKYTIAVTGTVSSKATTGIGSNLTFSAPVPEPAAWGMMTLGLGLIGSTLRRRAKALTSGAPA